MKCFNHPERENVRNCALCANQYCEECLVSLNGNNYCKSCLMEKVEESGQQVLASYHEVSPGERKSKFWAFIFSLIPGVGYLYLGLMNRGLQTMILFFGSILVAELIGFEELMALVAPVVIFYSVFDTQQMAKKLNAGMPVVDKQLFDVKQIPVTQSWVGYGLIVIGGLALLNNLMPFPFWMTIRRLLPPIIIICIGAAILYRNRKQEA